MMRFYHTVFDEKVRGDTLSRGRAQEGGEFGRAGRKGMCAFSEIRTHELVSVTSVCKL